MKMINYNKINIKLTLISMIVMSLIYSVLNAGKFLGNEFGSISFNEVFVSVAAFMILISAILSYFIIYKETKVYIAIIGFATPILYNGSTLLFGMPLSAVLSVYPIAFLDSIVFAIGAVGIYALINKNIK